MSDLNLVSDIFLVLLKKFFLDQIANIIYHLFYIIFAKLCFNSYNSVKLF